MVVVDEDVMIEVLRKNPAAICTPKIKCQTETNVIPSFRQTFFNSESNEAS